MRAQPRSLCLSLPHFLQIHSRAKSQFLSSKDVRQRFIDYFVSKDHVHVRSSSVRPFNDPTLEFVNAGMNQFKNVFLGAASSPCLRATNSQKCIRIGGKHNDLNVVGYDSYHHTFFEMLGNWSFGDYFKREACRMAWELVTSAPYSLDPNRLYVTYFGGDERLQLPPDNETKEIWREIGVRKDRILPFGIKDNFWEMGATGPCGPCTELHYDHLGCKSRPELVNTDLPDLTELWNLVFIQYNREADGSLSQLKQNFIDTGMGLERLVALLQGKRSNYDTDLFLPLFQTITKVTGAKEYSGRFGCEDVNNIDADYRILADHARMISTSIADNVFPEQGHGLRRVIRKALLASERFSASKSVNLLVELSKTVAETLGSAYPELPNSLKQIELVLRDESSLWASLRSQVKSDWEAVVILDPSMESLSEVQSSGLMVAIKELNNSRLTPGSVIPPKLALVLYDRCGLNSQLIEELAYLKDLKVDTKKLHEDIASLKEMNKAALFNTFNTQITSLSASLNQFEPTNDSYKYDLDRNHEGVYDFKEVEGSVLGVFSDGELLQEGDCIGKGKVGLLFDRTNFWSSVKGEGDRGMFVAFDGSQVIWKFKIDQAVNLNGYVIHFGQFQNTPSTLAVKKWTGVLKIDPKHRMILMRNNTASHLFSLALKKKFITNVQELMNTTKNFSTKYYFYGQKFSSEDLLEVEASVIELIRRQIDLGVASLSPHELNSHNNLLIPSYINLSHGNFRVFSCPHEDFNEITSGPCVLNTGDVLDVCVTNANLMSKGRECSFICLTGDDAVDLKNKSKGLLSQLLNYFKSRPKKETIEREVKKIRNLIANNEAPLALHSELSSTMKELNVVTKAQKLEGVVLEMNEMFGRAREKGQPYIVHYVGEDIKLEKITRLCQDMPIMLFAYNKGHLTGRCCVPQGANVSAGSWTKVLAELVEVEVGELKGYDTKQVCILKPIKVNRAYLTSTIEDLLKAAGTAWSRLYSERGEPSHSQMKTQ